MTTLQILTGARELLSDEAEIIIGSRAIWVNAPTGECIGRFGVWGIDVHRRMQDQHLGECLDCTHARVTTKDWARFQASMLEHHAVDLSGVPVPNFAAIERARADG
jgi:hypothetical protein